MIVSIFVKEEKKELSFNKNKWRFMTTIFLKISLQMSNGYGIIHIYNKLLVHIDYGCSIHTTIACGYRTINGSWMVLDETYQNWTPVDI